MPIHFGAKPLGVTSSSRSQRPSGRNIDFENGHSIQPGSMMIKPGPDDKVHPTLKLATVIDALTAEGISPDDALAGVGLSRNEVFSPTTLVSVDQLLKCYRNAS